jgi:esterase/lipase superfamily enzyme
MRFRSAILLQLAALALSGCATGYYKESYPEKAPPAPPTPESPREVHPVGSPPPAPTAGIPKGAPKPSPSCEDGDVFVQKIFYATDRSPDPKGGYGYARSADLNYGSTLVTIPCSHSAGLIESPNFWKLEFHRDPQKHFTIRGTAKLSKDDFFRYANETMRSGEESALVFVHGYNVTFHDAEMRTAQLAYDLQFEGAPILYSWPSRGQVGAYVADEQAAEITSVHLEQFLRELESKTNAKNIFVIAHSMGSRPLSRALAEIGKRPDAFHTPLSELILAAPDISVETFREQVMPFLKPKAVRNVTLYTSDNDKALKLSVKIHKDVRLGVARARPLAEGIDTIDASSVNTDFLGHSYFAESYLLLDDIRSLVQGGYQPDSRATLSVASDPPQRWVIRKTALAGADGVQ